MSKAALAFQLAVKSGLSKNNSAKKYLKEVEGKTDAEVEQLTQEIKEASQPEANPPE